MLSLSIVLPGSAVNIMLFAPADASARTRSTIRCAARMLSAVDGCTRCVDEIARCGHRRVERRHALDGRRRFVP